MTICSLEALPWMRKEAYWRYLVCIQHSSIIQWIHCVRNVSRRRQISGFVQSDICAADKTFWAYSCFILYSFFVFLVSWLYSLQALLHVHAPPLHMTAQCIQYNCNLPHLVGCWFQLPLDWPWLDAALPSAIACNQTYTYQGSVDTKPIGDSSDLAVLRSCWLCARLCCRVILIVQVVLEIEEKKRLRFSASVSQEAKYYIRLPRQRLFYPQPTTVFISTAASRRCLQMLALYRAAQWQIRYPSSLTREGKVWWLAPTWSLLRGPSCRSSNISRLDWITCPNITIFSLNWTAYLNISI